MKILTWYVLVFCGLISTIPTKETMDIYSDETISLPNFGTGEADGKVPEFCKCNPSRCFCDCKECSESQKDYWSLQRLLQFMPHNIYNIALSGFNFGVLKNNSFKDFSSLNSITIVLSNLTTVEANALQHLDNHSNITINFFSNNLGHIECGAFRHGKSFIHLELSNNQNLGFESAQNILHDFENVELHNLQMEGCGIVLDTLDRRFFKPLTNSKLVSLFFRGNTIKTLATDAFEPIKFLTHLWISNFMYITPSTLNVLQNLKEFRLFGGIQKSFGSTSLNLNLNNLQRLKNLRLDLTTAAVKVNLQISKLHLKKFVLIGSQDFAGHREQVLELLNNSRSLDLVDLSGNLLFQYTDDELCQLFQNKQIFRDLSLTKNYLSQLPKCMFQGMFNLRVLLLFKNRIIKIQKDLFKDLHNMKWLDLSQNSITFIDPSNMLSMPNLGRLYIDRNNFECSCELNGLRDVLKTKLAQPGVSPGRWVLHGYRFETCSKPDSRKHEFIHNYTIPWIECNTRLVVISCSATGSTILFLASLMAILLKHFWKDIKYMKMVRKARAHEEYAPIPDIQIEDDAFVSYHHEKTLWVERDMCRELENGDDIKFTLMYDDRIMPGGSIFTSLGNAINSCRKIIFVVSRGWVADAMNQFEVDMALVKLLDDHRDMIIVLLMEHIPKAEMPDKLKMMVKHNTCLRWSDNERLQAKFWRDLKLELGKHHFENI